ncbi:MAG TPA: Gfo/Idh/MocA family oxidoreductase [Bacillales bacterium]|nr:Gfo/Idh/MocA family oxidoreductase [Bacillales bacterium]
MIRTALLSRWHVHANDYAKQTQEHPNMEIAVVWDEDEARGRKWAEELGVPFEASLEAVLTDDSIDAVIVETPTNMHKEVILAAANYGKHIFTEKVLAFTTKDCDEIFEAVKTNGVHLMVSLPRLTESYFLYARDALDKGLLGELTFIRCRLAHNGAVPSEQHPNGWLPSHFFNEEQCGGGSLIDLGAHPIYLLNRLAGEAQAVTARLTQVKNDQVDDNAVVLLDYASGALGTIETGFVSARSPFQLELYGTEGALLVEDGKITLKSSRLQGEEIVSGDALPVALPSPHTQWAAAIAEGAEPSITKEDVRNLTRVNEAAALSARENRTVRLQELAV